MADTLARDELVFNEPRRVLESAFFKETSEALEDHEVRFDLVTIRAVAVLLAVIPIPQQASAILMPRMDDCSPVTEVPRLAPGEQLVGALHCAVSPPFLAWVVTHPAPQSRNDATKFPSRLRMTEGQLAKEALTESRNLLANISVDVTERTPKSITYIVTGTALGIRTSSGFSEIRLGNQIVLVRMATQPPLASHGTSLRKLATAFTHSFLSANVAARTK